MSLYYHQKYKHKSCLHMSVTVHYIVYFYPSLVWKLSNLNSSPGAANLHGFVTIPLTSGQRSLFLDPVCTSYMHLNLSTEVNHPLIISLTMILKNESKFCICLFWHLVDMSQILKGGNRDLRVPAQLCSASSVTFYCPLETFTTVPLTFGRILNVCCMTWFLDSQSCVYL